MKLKTVSDITGLVSGKLTAIEPASRAKDGQSQWHCRCDCGSRTVVTSGSIRRGLKTSCGCSEEPTVERRLNMGMSLEEARRVGTSREKYTALFTYKGQTDTLPQLLRDHESEVELSAVRERIKRGWTVEEAIDTPKYGARAS